MPRLPRRFYRRAPRVVPGCATFLQGRAPGSFEATTTQAELTDRLEAPFSLWFDPLVRTGAHRFHEPVGALFSSAAGRRRFFASSNRSKSIFDIRTRLPAWRSMFSHADDRMTPPRMIWSRNAAPRQSAGSRVNMTPDSGIRTEASSSPVLSPACNLEIANSRFSQLFTLRANGSIV